MLAAHPGGGAGEPVAQFPLAVALAAAPAAVGHGDPAADLGEGLVRQLHGGSGPRPGWPAAGPGRELPGLHGHRPAEVAGRPDHRRRPRRNRPRGLPGRVHQRLGGAVPGRVQPGHPPDREGRTGRGQTHRIRRHEQPDHGRPGRHPALDGQVPRRRRRGHRQRHQGTDLVLPRWRQPGLAAVQRRLPQPRLRPLPRRSGLLHGRRHAAPAVGLQRRLQPEVDHSDLGSKRSAR